MPFLGKRKGRRSNIGRRTKTARARKKLRLKQQKFNTWEPESNILDQKLVDEFEERCKDTGDLFIKDDVVSDDAVDSPTQSASRRAPPKTVLTKSEKEQQKQEKERQKKKKRESMTTDEIDAEREKARDRMRQFREKQKNGSEDGEEGTNSKRKRPSRSCAVPSGFWDPVVVRTTDSGIESHSEDDDKEDILRAKRRMKNFEPAPSNYDSCYTDQPVESSNGCINDLGESVFPKKKFALKPPTLDLSKKPLSDFVFKIEDLWADKVHESSVKALGYRVKIYECKSSKTLFTKNSDKLQPGDSNQKELDT